PEKVIAMTKFVQDDRAKRTKERLTVEQQMQANQEQIEFTKRQLGEKSGGSVRVERDAVIVVDKKAGAATARLSYLVGHASWRPAACRTRPPTPRTWRSRPGTSGPRPPTTSTRRSRTSPRSSRTTRPPWSSTATWCSTGRRSPRWTRPSGGSSATGRASPTR